MMKATVPMNTYNAFRRNNKKLQIDKKVPAMFYQFKYGDQTRAE